jgi:hypothetical protein
MKTLPNPVLIGVTVAALLLGVACSQAGSHDDDDSERLWSFDGAPAGSIPPGWEIAETRGRGTPAAWRVVADTTAPSSPNAIAISDAVNSGQTYNLLVATDASYRDLGIAVMVRACTGKQDQGGGPIWRALDADNYYVARWNPLEDNFRVYFVKDGRRQQIASADIKADPGTWHEIEIEHLGYRIEASLDGKQVIEVVDSTFTQAGMVGLWTKADAACAFDDLEVEATHMDDGEAEGNEHGHGDDDD